MGPDGDQIPNFLSLVPDEDPGPEGLSQNSRGCCSLKFSQPQLEAVRGSSSLRLSLRQNLLESPGAPWSLLESHGASWRTWKQVEVLQSKQEVMSSLRSDQVVSMMEQVLTSLI